MRANRELNSKHVRCEPNTFGPFPTISQKSDTLPLKLQSPSSSTQRRMGSRFGPPRSPVTGLISPMNSALRGTGASGCLSTCSTRPLTVTSAWRWRASNSRCRSGGSGGGAGRLGGALNAIDREMRQALNTGRDMGKCILRFAHENKFRDGAEKQLCPHAKLPAVSRGRQRPWPIGQLR